MSTKQQEIDHLNAMAQHREQSAICYLQGGLLTDAASELEDAIRMRASAKRMAMAQADSNRNIRISNAQARLTTALFRFSAHYRQVDDLGNYYLNELRDAHNLAISIEAE